VIFVAVFFATLLLCICLVGLGDMLLDWLDRRFGR
jgi:hypothetical protein